MPQRPSKKAKVRPNAKPGADDPEKTRAEQQRARDERTKTILGRFQGRKSIERA